MNAKQFFKRDLANKPQLKKGNSMYEEPKLIGQSGENLKNDKPMLDVNEIKEESERSDSSSSLNDMAIRTNIKKVSIDIDGNSTNPKARRSTQINTKALNSATMPTGNK